MRKFEHTVGSHSDDRGGTYDRRCDCQDKPHSCTAEIIAELERLLCPIDCHYGDNCKIEHTRLRKSYIKDRIKELKNG